MPPPSETSQLVEELRRTIDNLQVGLRYRTGVMYSILYTCQLSGINQVSVIVTYFSGTI